MIKISKAELEELEAILELKSMPREQLDKVDFTNKKWLCGCKGCIGSTTVRDYGIAPEYYWPLKGKQEWFNIERNYFMCGKHYKRLKKLAALYGWTKVEEKMIDFSKPKFKEN